MSKFFKKKNKGPAPYEARGFRSGFTLVEMLVAVSIFTVSLLGIMAVLAGSIANTNYAKRKMVATYLAQEGIEFIRNVRDTEVLYTTSSGWADFKDAIKDCDSPSSSDKYCYFNDLDVIKKCDIGGKDCPPLKYNPDTGKYNYSLGENSGFVRSIQAKDGGSSDEVKIFSKVEWTQGSGAYSITFSENLFNWIE